MSRRAIYAFGNTCCAIGGGGISISTAPLSPLTSLPASFSTMQFFGDSMTAGSNASDAAHRYVNLVAAALSATLVNNGISATVAQNSNDNLGAPRANNGRDRFVATLLTSPNKRKAVSILYGYNDARWTAGGDINSTNYLNDMREMLIGLILGGYSWDEILCHVPVWISDEGLLAGSAEFSGQTRAGFEEYVTNAVSVAAEFGVYTSNQYTNIRDNGGATLIDTDDIHPTDAGHEQIKVGVLASTMNNNGRVGNIRLTSTTATSLTVTWDAVAGAASYDLDAFLRGALTPAATVTDSPGLAVQMLGLSAGEYSARVRAVYGDGTKGPWGWAVIPYHVGTTLVMRDDFYTDGLITSMTTDIGNSTWSVLPGSVAPSANALISNGRVHSNSVADRAAYWADDIVPASADYEVGGYLTARTLATTGQVGVAVRMDATNDNYYFARYADSVTTPAFALFARTADGATNTQISTSLTRTVREGEIIKFAVRAVGTTISLLLDDVVQKTGTNSSITLAGKPGFYVAGNTVNANAGPHLNNIYMVAL